MRANVDISSEGFEAIHRFLRYTREITDIPKCKGNTMHDTEEWLKDVESFNYILLLLNSLKEVDPSGHEKL